MKLNKIKNNYRYFILISVGLFLMLFYPRLTSAQERPYTIDDRFAGVAQKVQEFGGLFLGDNGSIVYIYLTDLSKQNDVELAIAEVLNDDRLAGKRVKVLQGQYGWLQLKDWHERMISVLSLPGVILTDIDESKNRLSVGIESLEVRSAVEQVLAELTIPRAAVDIVVTEPIRAIPLEDQGMQVQEVISIMDNPLAIGLILGLGLLILVWLLRRKKLFTKK